MEQRKSWPLDHDNDPKELTNLASLPANAVSVKELSSRLAQTVKGSFAAPGRIPEAREGHWSPVIR